MQITGVRVCADDPLAVQFQRNAQHAMGGGMLRPHVEDHMFGRVNTLWERRLNRIRVECLCAQRGEVRIVPGHAERHFFAAQRLVFAQWMADPIPRHHDAPQIGVTGKAKAHQIERLTLHAEC